MPLYIPNNQLTLYKGVKLVNGEHQRYFTSRSAQLAYFNSHEKLIKTNIRYTRDDIPMAVGMNQEALRDYNYVMFKNDDFSGKYVFAFIRDLIVASEGVTLIDYEVDVYQTRLFDMTWQPSYIEREHQPQWQVSGRPILNTLDEGLDYGSDYQIVHEHTIKDGNLIYFIIASTVRLDLEESDPLFESGTSVHMPSMLNYYVIPMRYLGDSFQQGIVNGVELSPLSYFFMALKNVDIANAIVSISVTPYLSVPHTTIGGAVQSTALETFTKEFEIVDEDQPEQTVVNITMARLTRDSSVSKQTFVIDSNVYSKFTTRSESKLMMYPYVMIEINDNAGHSLSLRPEYLPNGSLTVQVMSTVGTTPKTGLAVSGYNITGEPNKLDGLYNSTVHTIPVKNDNLASFIQSNHNAVKVSNAGSVAQMFEGLVGIALGAVSGGVGGGIMALSGGSQISSGITNILGTQAKREDIDNTNPTMQNMGNNADFDYSNDLYGFTIRYKEIKPEYAYKLSRIFKMYGYKSNDLKVPNLNTRPYFNYIKTINANIQGSMSSPELRALKDMFNNGLTLWHTNDIGNYNLDNEGVE